MSAKQNNENVTASEEATIPAPRVSATALVTTTPRLSEVALKGIGESGNAFDDALALLAETYGMEAVVTASNVLGDGFAILENKDSLIGVTFVCVGWDFTIGDHGEFVVVRVVTIDNRKLIMLDGSTGIFKQLEAYTANTGRTAGMVVKAGLRRSDYTYKDDKGEEKNATTYYLDVSA